MFAVCWLFVGWRLLLLFVVCCLFACLSVCLLVVCCLLLVVLFALCWLLSLGVRSVLCAVC